MLLESFMLYFLTVNEYDKRKQKNNEVPVI